jgi:hypothetical protein
VVDIIPGAEDILNGERLTLDRDVVLDDEFAEWLDELDADQCTAILALATLSKERTVAQQAVCETLEGTAIPDVK